MRESRLRCPKCKSKKLAVWHRLSNRSAFNGYRWTPSDYSRVLCLRRGCRYSWRTRADVSHVRDVKGHEAR